MIRRLLPVALVGALLATTGAAAAPAERPTAWCIPLFMSCDDPTPTPSPKVTTSVNGDQVTITTDLATARALCARVGTTEHRLEALITLIQGDAATPGSAAYLRARAQHAASAGHDDTANVLNARATRRADRVTALQHSLDRLKTVDADVCAALPAAGQ